MKRSKKYVAVSQLVDKTKTYTAQEAIELVKQTSTVKFDATIDVSFRLNVDPKKADQQVRGTLVLPHGNGKTKTVLAITDKTDEATAAGADYVGGKEILENLYCNDNLPILKNVIMHIESKRLTLDAFKRM